MKFAVYRSSSQKEFSDGVSNAIAAILRAEGLQVFDDSVIKIRMNCTAKGARDSCSV